MAALPFFGSLPLCSIFAGMTAVFCIGADIAVRLWRRGRYPRMRLGDEALGHVTKFNRVPVPITTSNELLTNFFSLLLWKMIAMDNAEHC